MGLSVVAAIARAHQLRYRESCRAEPGRRWSAAQQAESIVTEEANAFHCTLAARRAVPTLKALSHRLEEIRREELERFCKEVGSLTGEQEKALEELSSRTVDRVASLLEREPKTRAEAPEIDRMVTAAPRLFRLPQTCAGAQREA